MNNEIIVQSNSSARAELDVQIATAKAYPRELTTFIERLTKLATMDLETAQSCFYTVPVGKENGKEKHASGPSIRLAEMASSSWQNFHSGSRFVSNDGKFIIVEGVAWDLENNVRTSKQVALSIRYKDGGTYSTDMQKKMTNAGQSIALRNAVFSVIPKALVDRVCDIAKKFAVGDQKTLDERRQKSIDYFKKMGITEDKIYSFFNIKGIDEITLTHLEYLLGVATAIKENRIDKDQAFFLDAGDDQGASNDLGQKLKDLEKKKMAAQQAQPNNQNLQPAASQFDMSATQTTKLETTGEPITPRAAEFIEEFGEVKP